MLIISVFFNIIDLFSVPIVITLDIVKYNMFLVFLFVVSCPEAFYCRADHLCDETLSANVTSPPYCRVVVSFLASVAPSSALDWTRELIYHKYLKV